MEDYVESPESVNINFKGIEMRGFSESHASKRFKSTLEEHEVSTRFGIPIRVYVQRSNKNTALLTFHDIGTNHNSFMSFFNYPEMRVILENFTVYHVCAPGHHQDSNLTNSEPVRDEKAVLTRSSSTEEGQGIIMDIFTIFNPQKRQSVISNYPTIDDLADMIGDVLDNFDIKYFVGFGVGAGSNVLTRFALMQPNRLHGLLLINPDDTTSGYWQWGKSRWSDLPSMKTGIITDSLIQFLLNHWFGSDVERNLDVEEWYIQNLRELHMISAAGYIEAFLNRTVIGMARPANEFDVNCRTLKVDALLVCGELDREHVSQMTEMNGNLNPVKTQFITMPDCNGMIMEEAPERLSVLVLNFLRNIGLLVSLTPEKLHKLARDKQVERAIELQEIDISQIQISNQC